MTPPARAETVAAARVDRGRVEKARRRQPVVRPTDRERAWLLYAWCRAGDDLVDGQCAGHGMTAVADAPVRVERLRVLTERALANGPTGEPAFDGFAIVAHETAMPPAWAHALIDGFALDASGWRPATEADLHRYCWHVAGAVGCMMAVVMGVAPDDEATLDRAADLGVAFQLANIARDIGEDAAAGRCYLPADWLAGEGLTADTLMVPANRSALARLACRLADQAAAFEASARAGAAALSFRSAWAVLAAARIYGAIGREVARRGERAWDARVSTSTAAKLRFIARASVEAAGRHRLAAAPRPAWDRPR